MVSSQILEIERLSPSTMRGRYITLLHLWSTFEVLRVCLAEMHPSLSYIGSRLINNQECCYWSLFLSERAFRFAAFLLWEVYDKQRLWYFPRHPCQMIRQLELYIPLESQANVEEVQVLLNTIERVDWDALSDANVHAGEPTRHDRHPGRRKPSALYFVFFDPWEIPVTTWAHALALCEVLRSVSLGRPIGFMFYDDWHAAYEDDPMMNDYPK